MFSPQTNFAGLVEIVVNFINSLVPLLGTIAVVIFLYGVVRYIYQGGETKSKNEAKEYMGWGLLGLFVIFSIWGIINIFLIAFQVPAGQAPSGAGLF